MTDLSPISQSRKPQGSAQELSFEDRLYAITTVSALSLGLFEQLAVTLNIPTEMMPPDTASRSQRSKALLDWVEGPTGPGLATVDRRLQALVPGAAKPTAFAISGHRGELSTAELESIVRSIQQQTGDASIHLAFYIKDSIELVLNGTPEGLEKLRALFDANALTPVLGHLQVSSVHSIDSNITAARKARLIQALTQEVQCRKCLRNMARAVVIDIDSLSNCKKVGTLLHKLDQARDRVQNIINDCNRLSARSFARILVRTLDRAYTRISAYDRDCDRTRFSDVQHALDQDRFGDALHALDQVLISDRALIRDILNESDVASDIGLARDIASKLIDIFDSVSILSLIGIDLKGANLKRLNLVGTDLTGTNLTDAIVDRTVFGNNPGLTQSDQRDLQQRGAIFQDLPGSDLPALIRR